MRSGATTRNRTVGRRPMGCARHAAAAARRASPSTRPRTGSWLDRGHTRCSRPRSTSSGGPADPRRGTRAARARRASRQVPAARAVGPARGWPIQTRIPSRWPVSARCGDDLAVLVARRRSRSSRGDDAGRACWPGCGSCRGRPRTSASSGRSWPVNIAAIRSKNAASDRRPAVESRLNTAHSTRSASGSGGGGHVRRDRSATSDRARSRAAGDGWAGRARRG